jgi:CelD/BcsL family acetyltransferase involved in cellulose biosynthesis
VCPTRARKGREVTPSTAAKTPWPGLAVDVLGGETELAGLEKSWTALVEKTGIDHPFLSHEWIGTWWECFGSGKQLRVFVVRQGKEVVSIAPLMIHYGKLCGVGVRLLESIANVHTPRFDFIVGDRTATVYKALWKAFLSRQAEWDVLRLCQLPADSNTLVELSQNASDEGHQVGVWTSEESPYLYLRGTWANYWNARRGRYRAMLRNHLRRLSRFGQAQREVVVSEAEVQGALDEGFEIEAAAWKRRAGTAIVSDPAAERFYRRFASRAARRGWLRLSFLTVGGQRIAFAYGLRYRKIVRLLKTGYLPSYARGSPSTLLCSRDLEAAFAEGSVEFDFLGGREANKMEWTASVRPHCWLFIFRKDGLARWLHPLKFRLIPFLKRAPDYLKWRNIALALVRKRELEKS